VFNSCLFPGKSFEDISQRNDAGKNKEREREREISFESWEDRNNNDRCERWRRVVVVVVVSRSFLCGFVFFFVVVVCDNRFIFWKNSDAGDVGDAGDERGER